MGIQQFTPSYPTTDQMRARWATLGEAIAEASPPSTERIASQGRGKLTVLGSGISYGSLSIDVEDEIRAADYVFYSINDYVTKSWVNLLRPDAYDLAILYSEQIDRHATYTRMAEALLHFVRQGMRVAAVFYGHPGIFAAPGHRAVQIARKEGHVARMRPGISALDCLIADIGFDPALPGMITYEATDMLLRNRHIDTTLHMIIWQVGVVGEFGYSRKGYGNRGIGVLVDVLEAAYGADWELIHYVAPQYAGLEPRIQNLPIGALREPKNNRILSTLSTFYIPPRDVAVTDPGRAEALGTKLPTPSPRARRQRADYTRYTARELAALAEFSHLAVSPQYEVVERNALLDFFAELSTNAALRHDFEAEPESTLEREGLASLSESQKRLLVTRHYGAVAAALNELRVAEGRQQSGDRTS